jgi:hypothetical protein
VNGVLGRELRLAAAALEVAAPDMGFGARDVAARMQRSTFLIMSNSILVASRSAVVDLLTS